MIEKEQTDFSLLLSFLYGSLSSRLYILTSYEQEPNLRIPSVHQNQTHGICHLKWNMPPMPIMMLVSVCILLEFCKLFHIARLEFFQIIPLYSYEYWTYLLRRNLSVLKLGIRQWRIPFGWGSWTFSKAERESMIEVSRYRIYKSV